MAHPLTLLVETPPCWRKAPWEGGLQGAGPQGPGSVAHSLRFTLLPISFFFFFCPQPPLQLSWNSPEAPGSTQLSQNGWADVSP